MKDNKNFNMIEFEERSNGELLYLIQVNDIIPKPNDTKEDLMMKILVKEEMNPYIDSHKKTLEISGEETEELVKKYGEYVAEVIADTITFPKYREFLDYKWDKLWDNLKNYRPKMTSRITYPTNIDNNICDNEYCLDFQGKTLIFDIEKEDLYLGDCIYDFCVEWNELLDETDIDILYNSWQNHKISIINEIISKKWPVCPRATKFLFHKFIQDEYLSPYILSSLCHLFSPSSVLDFSISGSNFLAFLSTNISIYHGWIKNLEDETKLDSLYRKYSNSSQSFSLFPDSPLESSCFSLLSPDYDLIFCQPTFPISVLNDPLSSDWFQSLLFPSFQRLSLSLSPSGYFLFYLSPSYLSKSPSLLCFLLRYLSLLFSYQGCLYCPSLNHSGETILNPLWIFQKSS